MTITTPTSTHTGGRTLAAGATGFTGSPRLAANLQAVLVDLIELHLVAKQAHWNVVGPNFRGLHLLLDEVVDAAREAADTLAERMRALGSTPDGRSDTVASTTSLPALPAGELSTATAAAAVAVRLRTAASTARAVHDQVDAEDPSSADLLHAVIGTLEKQAWMLAAETGAVGTSPDDVA
ncbi:DNA starvation/stationary phase protection protein [Micromonospora sp. NBC_00898]|uniref:Dps family protein n=1 Tax=Micromonospora sp. NBC_00898 TaxID=2975981 RepID=UPI00386D8AEE|nr:DNA starvation/stationary phase protection protein [Micromonospora sp. NBC_00898]